MKSFLSLLFWFYVLFCLSQMGCKTENQSVLKDSDTVKTSPITHGFDTTAGFVKEEDNYWAMQLDTTLPGEVLHANLLTIDADENQSKQSLWVQFSGMDVPDTVMYPTRCPQLSVLSRDTTDHRLSLIASLDFECYQNYEVGGIYYSIELLSLKDAGDIIAITDSYSGELGQSKSTMTLYAIYAGQLVSVGEFVMSERSDGTEGDDEQSEAESEEAEEPNSTVISATITISDHKTLGIPNLIYKSETITTHRKTYDEVIYTWYGRGYE